MLWALVLGVMLFTGVALYLVEPHNAENYGESPTLSRGMANRYYPHVPLMTLYKPPPELVAPVKQFITKKHDACICL